MLLSSPLLILTADATITTTAILYTLLLLLMLLLSLQLLKLYILFCYHNRAVHQTTFLTHSVAHSLTLSMVGTLKYRRAA
jgi:hypothetical protein